MKYSTIYMSYVGYVIGIFAHPQFATTIDKCIYVRTSAGVSSEGYRKYM